jgi:flagellar biosynthesis/type III secretory pathway M-ring protein FliF/YscJ
VNQAILGILAKGVFGGSIFLILYIVYREFMENRIKTEQAEIKLGEKTNADIVQNESDSDLVDRLNEQFSIPTDISSDPSSKGSTGPISGSSSADGSLKKPRN